jgi:transposase InsO family protein
MALDQPGPLTDLVHHSDRGSQYASTDYQRILADHNITCSMSRKGNCYDNAVAESFFHSLKAEWVNHHQYLNRTEATSSIFYYIEIFYNRKRRHSTLGYSTPQDYNLFQLAA